MTARTHFLVPLAVIAGLIAGPTPAVASPLEWSSAKPIYHQPPFTGGADLRDVSCPSASLCVAVDGDGNVVSSKQPTGGASAWKVTRVPGRPPFQHISCPSRSLCVALAANGAVATSRQPTAGGSTWKVKRLGAGLYDVSCASPSLCVAVGAHAKVLVTRHPTRGPDAWRLAYVHHGNSSAQLRAVSCPSRKLCAALGRVGSKGAVLTSRHPTRGRGAWKLAPVGGREMRDISCASARLCVAVSRRYENNLFTSTDPAGGRHAWATGDLLTNSLHSVSCASQKLCAAGTGDGEVFVSPRPASGDSTWQRAGVAAASLDGVSCPVASFCVAAGGGSLVMSNAPSDGSSWTRTTVTSYNPLAHVSCASRALCVATDYRGEVVDSSRPTRGAATWRVTRVHAHALIDIWCQSVSLCVAVDEDDNVLTSTAPTGGAGAWSSDPVANAPSFGGVTCASTSLCVAGGRFNFVATSTDPPSGGSSWNVVQLGMPGVRGSRDPAEISCPAPSLCVALGFNGGVVGADRVFSSSDPTGGADAWRIVDPHANRLSDVSCPSVHLCVVVRSNSSNQVLTSTRPTGGGSAWKVTEIRRPSQPREKCGARRPGGSDRRPCATLRAVSCGSKKLCVAVGRFRGRDVAYVSTDPTGGTKAWKRARVHADGRFGLTDVSCPSPKLCLIVDDHGRAFVGTARR